MYEHETMTNMIYIMVHDKIGSMEKYNIPHIIVDFSRNNYVCKHRSC
jgi:hypothetical protein